MSAMDKPKIEYYTVISNTPVGLDESVTGKLAEGWQLQGGVAVCVVLNPYPEVTPSENAFLYTYAQAMIKQIEENSMFS
jgi:hypothetical protein